jgi:genome maintenance exonuclease 1
VVDLIPLRKIYNYEQIEREEGPGGRSYGKDRLPSVTRILDATKDKTYLKDWVDRVGQEEADRIKNTSSRIGMHMHTVVERMVAYRDLPKPTNWDMIKGYELGYRLIREQFHDINEIWGSEVILWSPGRYAGTTDMVGVYRGKSAIIDFKQSNKPKRHEWIKDYWHQVSAYALAHDALFGTHIEMGVVMVALQTGGTQVFTTMGAEFNGHKADWLERVEQYYCNVRSKGNS